jgi:hypothetical protein
MPELANSKVIVDDLHGDPHADRGNEARAVHPLKIAALEGEGAGVLGSLRFC